MQWSFRLALYDEADNRRIIAWNIVGLEQTEPITPIRRNHDM